LTVYAGMLHTVAALQLPLEHAAVALHPGLKLTHRVDESLLQRAIAGADTDELIEGARPHVQALVDGGAAAVLVSCSSLGQAVDTLAAEYSVPVLRIDRPMARRALEVGPRVLVLATLTSTLVPTTALIRSEAVARAATPHVNPVVVGGAAQAKAAGDNATHDRLIREAAHRHEPEADVVVLAQASMAEAFSDDDAMSIPVLSSPELGIRAFVDTLRPIKLTPKGPGGPHA
jgi:Asp/Glu/hydantoin racemase